jgi:hypothetical protein
MERQESPPLFHIRIFLAWIFEKKLSQNENKTKGTEITVTL